MENKPVSHCDMELLKMAMLRHEEIFRQQVHELHRLYRVQKQLMGMGSGLSTRPSSSELSCRRRQIRRRRRQQPRRALPRLPADDECVAVTPPSSVEDGLDLTLAIGSSSGGRGRRRRRDETESTGTDTPTPLGSESDDISGGSLTTTMSSSSTDTGGSPPYQIQRAIMPPAFRLQEATTRTVAKQPPRSPWLVQCVSLEMA